MLVSLIKLALVKVIDLINFLIIIRCILSWLPIGQNRFIEVLYTVTDPVLEPVRRLMDKTFGGSGGMMIDFSPVIAFLLLGLIQRLIIML